MKMSQNYLNKKIQSLLHNKYALLLSAIFLVAIFFRFYNIPARYGFDYDAARDVLVSLEGARNIRFPLTGPPSAQGSFSFGPWYYYLLIIATTIFPFGYAPWILIGVSSVAVVLIMYFIGKNLEDMQLGIILAALTAAATSQITVATNLSNPDIVPFTASISILFFILFLKGNRNKLVLIVWGFFQGIGVLSHFQMVALFILPTIVFIFKKKNILFNLLFFCLGLILSFIPTIVFEFQNNWYNSRGILYYLKFGPVAPVYFPNSWKIYIFQFWPNFWANTLGVPFVVGIGVMISIIFSFVYLSYKKKLNNPFFALIVAFILVFIGFRYYSGERAVYYLYFLQPFVLILTGYAIWSLKNLFYGKYLPAIALILLYFFIIPRNIAAFKTTESFKDYNYYARQIMLQSKNKPVALYNCMSEEKNRAYAIAYILAVKNKLSNSGEKYMLYGPACPKEMIEKLPEVKGQNIKVKPEKFAMLRVKSLTKLEPRWTLISPEKIFDNITVTLNRK